ncbi:MULTISPECIES: hypothetical protein [unclassified Halomonas]|nr:MULTISPECIES: hypothetical protein [unclassified Halomonas]MBY5925756.1 hypothetical protein [Halomonas sp. DP4Y7-2]MBY6232798.1 hypothetical protein [Halomonas sp. DP4Y7-1]
MYQALQQLGRIWRGCADTPNFTLVHPRLLTAVAIRKVIQRHSELSHL